MDLQSGDEMTQIAALKPWRPVIAPVLADIEAMSKQTSYSPELKQAPYKQPKTKSNRIKASEWTGHVFLASAPPVFCCWRWDLPLLTVYWVSLTHGAW